MIASSGIRFRDTLLLVLRGEWTKLPPAVKTHLSVTLMRTSAALHHPEALRLCQHVIRLVKNPWDDPTLSNILQGNASFTDDEGKISVFFPPCRSRTHFLVVSVVLQFCMVETPRLLSIRLEMLCDSKCEDFALKLVAACRKCLQHSTDSRFLQCCTASQKEYWQDLHIALLYRFKKNDEVILLLKQLSLDDGYQLVNRFISKGSSSSGDVSTFSSRVWRSSLKIAELANQCLLATGLFRCPPPPCLSDLTVQLVKLQRKLGKSNQALVDMLRTLVHHADLITSAHMYILCSALSQLEVTSLYHSIIWTLVFAQLNFLDFCVRLTQLYGLWCSLNSTLWTLVFA